MISTSLTEEFRSSSNARVEISVFWRLSGDLRSKRATSRATFPCPITATFLTFLREIFFWRYSGSLLYQPTIWDEVYDPGSDSPGIFNNRGAGMPVHIMTASCRFPSS
jgi:hypothetical protein